MPELLHNPLVSRHAREMLALEREELERLRPLYEQVRLDQFEKLAHLPGESFGAHQIQGVLVQVEIALRAMSKRLRGRAERRLQKQLQRSIDQILAEIAHFEPRFGSGIATIQTSALAKLTEPQGLLLDKLSRSLVVFSAQVRAEFAQRLGVHALKKSPMREVAIDLAGRLETHGFRGARWRAERIARTELMDAWSTGHQAALEAALEAAAEVLPDLKRQWDATLDARTSELCKTLNGQVRDLDKPWVYKGRQIARPPGLPNCRARLTAWRREWARQEAA